MMSHLPTRFPMSPMSPQSPVFEQSPQSPAPTRSPILTRSPMSTQSPLFSPVEIKSRSEIFTEMNPLQLNSQKKSAMKVVEKTILNAMISNPAKMQTLKNTAFLFIRRMQEAVNDKGNPEWFHFGKIPDDSFGEIDLRFYKKLAKERAYAINILCCHKHSPLGDRKVTLFGGTNYTGSASALIKRITEITIETIQNAAEKKLDRTWNRYRAQHADQVLARTQDVLAMEDIHRIIHLSPTARDENGDSETYLKEIATIRESHAEDAVARFKHLIDRGMGNCGELAILAYLRLKYGAHRENAEIRTIGMSTHCFVMIPHPTQPEKNTIVDPWVKYLNLPAVDIHRAGRQLGYRPQAIKGEERQRGFCGTLPEFTAFLRNHPLIAESRENYEFKKRESPFHSEAEEREVYEYMMAKVRAATAAPL